MSPTPHAAPGHYQLLTGPGPAAIAVVRVCGRAVGDFVARHVRLRRVPTETDRKPGRIWRAALLDANQTAIDDMLVSVHAAAPAWDLCLHMHGNPWLVRECEVLLRAVGLAPLRTPVVAGTWPAETLVEAEAWALLPDMLTLRGAQWLLAQVALLPAAIADLLSDAGLERVRDRCAALAQRRVIADWFAHPLRVALVGPPNAGKSTLANALADRVVSVVSSSAGTTRDWIEIPAEAGGFPMIWLDTAGLRPSASAVEAAGIERTRQLMHEADAVVLVLDASDTSASASSLTGLGEGPVPACVALNKTDVASSVDDIRRALQAVWQGRAITISALQRTGLDTLCNAVLTSAGRALDMLELPATFTTRQAALLQAAAENDHNILHTMLLQLIGSAPDQANPVADWPA